MKRKGRGRPVTGHVKVQFNIRPEINAMIEAAATKEGITRSQYIENLVQACHKNATEDGFSRENR